MLLSALDLLTQIGLVHSDLKPENIMLSLSDNKIQSLKLIDFGSSFHFASNKQELSTPEYLPPEVLLKKFCEMLPWSLDVWSLGIVLLEILIGFPVYMAYKGRVTKGSR